MRIFAAFATASLLAATPCVAQVIISGPDDNAARHEQYHADRQEHGAQRDEARARQDAAEGNYGAAQHEQDRAMDHQADAQRDQNRAAQDSQGGVMVQVR